MVLMLVEFVAFTALVAVLSYRKTKDENLATEDGYFLAGRDLPGIVIAGSLMMTNLSAEQLVGTNGQSFAGNMSPIAWEATSAFALIVLAFFLLPKFLKGGITTLPEFFQMRYDTFTMRLFAILFLIAYVFTMLPVILYSGAVALQAMFNITGIFHLSYFGAITLMCIIAGVIGLCYAVFGGLKAIAYSDTINGVGLLIGGFTWQDGRRRLCGWCAPPADRHPGENECMVAGQCAAALYSLADPLHGHVREQPVLLGDKPVDYPAFSGCQESEGSAEGRYLGRLL